MSTVQAVLMRIRSDLRVRWRAWSVLAIVIGLVGAVVLATAAGARRTDTSYGRFLVTSHAADVLISPGLMGLHGFDAAVAKLPEVASAAPASGMDVFTTDPSHQDVIALSGLDGAFGHTIERPKIAEGRLSDPSKADEAVAIRSAAQALHLHAGDTLHLIAAPTTSEGPDLSKARQVTLKIVGIGVSRDDAVPVNSLSSQPTLLTSPLFRKQFDDTFNSFDGDYLRLRPGASIGAISAKAQALAAKYPETTGSAIIADEHQQAAAVERAIRPQAGALALFSLLVALVGLFVIGQLAIRQVASASDDHVVLREVGMTRRDLLAVGLGEVGVVAVIGSIIAVVVSWLLSPLTPIGAARIAEPTPGFTINWAMVGLGALAIVVLLVAWVAWPVWRIAGRAVEGHATFARPSRIAAALARSGSVAASVGARFVVQPGRGRGAVPMRTAIAGTVVAIGALAATLVFGTNLVRLIDTPHLYGQTWSVGVDTGFGQVPGSAISKYLAKQPDVQGWTNGNHLDLMIDGHEVPAVGLESGHGATVWPAIVEGRAPRRPDEIVLGAKSLAAAHAHVGDRVRVGVQGGDGTQQMRVVGRAVFPLFGQGSFTPTGLGDGAAMINPVPASQSCPPGEADRGPCFSFFLIDTVPGHTLDPATLTHGLEKAGVCPADQQCNVFTSQRPVDVDNYARVRSTPIFLTVVLGLLAIATLAHLALTTTRRRRHDLAVLRTLGFVRRQVAGAVSWQATVLLAVALVVGLPVGVALGRWLWTLFAGRLGAVVSISVPVGWLLLTIPIALLLANVAAVGPAWRAARRSPGPALRTE
jgi:ABC-type lipoprotein release transport system permease subunit